jgi:hypothetical protein
MGWMGIAVSAATNEQARLLKVTMAPTESGWPSANTHEVRFVFLVISGNLLSFRGRVDESGFSRSLFLTLGFAHAEMHH